MWSVRQRAFGPVYPRLPVAGAPGGCGQLRPPKVIIRLLFRQRFGQAVPKSALVFIEVKAVRAGSKVGPERPIAWVTPRKQAQVRRLATAWVAERRSGGAVPRYAELRFDAVGVVLGRDDEVVDLEHLVGAF